MNDAIPWWDMTAAELAREYPEDVRESAAVRRLRREQAPQYARWERECRERMAAEKAERAARGIKW